MDPDSPRVVARWLPSVLSLTLTALALFWGFYCVDYFLPEWAGGPHVSSPLGRYLDFEPALLSDAFSSLAGVMAAVFGIVVTVVSIIVQLTADRFAGVTRMFLRDRTNRGVIGYYIVVCICGVWLSPALHSQHVPKAALLGVLCMTTLGLVVMAPYFGYVFWFLEPMNIVRRIQQRAQSGIRPEALRSQAIIQKAQARVLSSVEELTDIVRHGIADKDKIVASGAVDALKDLTVNYLSDKPSMGSDWFRVGPDIRDNPDFVAMDAESLRELEGRHTWFEWKVMRQYLGLYNEALREMRDINYLIAIDTRYIGEAALKAGDSELSALVLRYMNSYLRATLNASDVRTAYNVMNQYRLLVESQLRAGAVELACQGARHMKYYGHVGFEQSLTFVTETVAFDLSTLCEAAHACAPEAEERILSEFLQLDRPLRTSDQEKALLGVRKAQVKLACFYLAQGRADSASRIARDMAGEPGERLAAIREQLAQVKSKDFWEIIDRGRNFEFMEPAERARLPEFFDVLLRQAVAELAASPSPVRVPAASSPPPKPKV